MLNDSKIATYSIYDTFKKTKKKKTKKHKTNPKTVNPKGKKKKSAVGGGSDEQTEHNTSTNPGVNYRL